MPAQITLGTLGNNMTTQQIEPMNELLERTVGKLALVHAFIIGVIVGFTSAILLVVFAINWALIEH